MTHEELMQLVAEELDNVAPGCGVTEAQPTDDLRDAIDIDSMDFLNFVIAIHKRLGIRIPESDYGKLITLDGIAAYLKEKGV